jgi:hypothetical protein
MYSISKCLALGTALAGLSPLALAAPILTMFESVSGTTVNVNDNGLGDMSGMSGVVLWSGAIGAFNVSVNTGLTKPVLGSPTSPNMDLGFVANAVGPGNLTITFSDDGFTYTGSLTDIFGGTAGTNSLVTNSVLENGTSFISQGPFSPGAFSATSSALVSLVPADVLAVRVNITTTGAGVSSGDKNVFANVPDSGWSISLLGAAMLGIVAIRKKFHSV